MKNEYEPKYKTGDAVQLRAFYGVFNHPMIVHEVYKDSIAEDRAGEPGAGHMYICKYLLDNNIITRKILQKELEPVNKPKILRTLERYKSKINNI